MVMEATSGMYMILTLAMAFKIAIYIGVLVLAFLIDIVTEKKEKLGMQGLNVMAIAFVLVGIAEFFHVLAVELNIFPILASHENLDLTVHPLFIIGSLGLLWFLWGVSRNIKQYR
jgi:hypothetical protein